MTVKPGAIHLVACVRISDPPEPDDVELEPWAGDPETSWAGDIGGINPSVHADTVIRPAGSGLREGKPANTAGLLTRFSRRGCERGAGVRSYNSGARRLDLGTWVICASGIASMSVAAAWGVAVGVVLTHGALALGLA